MSQQFFVSQDAKRIQRYELKEALNNSAIRVFLRRILEKSGVMSHAMTDGNPINLAYNEGMRRIGLWIVDEIESSRPGEVARLMLESSIERELDKNNKTN